MTDPSQPLKTLFDLTGQVAIVTGGSRGLGFQMAEALGEYGATVILTARKQHELDAAVAFAKADKADTSKLAVTGFCWGGRVVWKYTATTPGVSAGAAWNGPLGPMPPPSPVQLAAQMKGRVIGFYGGKDMGIPEAHRQAMLDALKAAGDSRSNINVYPNSPHGFNADYRPSYVEADAKDAWAKMLAWFKAYGVA